MTKSNISRRGVIEAGVGLTVANLIPGTTPLAFAASMEERTVAAGKAAGAADVSGMIWSPYLVPMQPVIAEFKKQTGMASAAFRIFRFSTRRSGRWRRRCRARRSSTSFTSIPT